MNLPPQLSLRNLKQRLFGVIDVVEWKRNIGVSDVIILGPWLGEVGPELQYWIPFLQRAKAKGFLKDRKVIAVSRGGVQAWYGNIADEYIDIFDHLNINEYKKMRSKIFKTTQKQVTIHPLERQFIRKIVIKHQISSYSLVHPSVMWQLVVAWLQEKTSLSKVLSQLLFRKLSASPSSYVLYVDKLKLPKDFIAVRFYTSHVFVASKNIVRQINSILQIVSHRIPIVILSTNYRVDDHKTLPLPKTSRIIHVGLDLPLRINLGIQTEVIRRSKGFMGTNGGISVLPAFVDVPTLSFYNTVLGEYVSFYSKHETVTGILNEELNQGRYAVVNLNAWKMFADWFAQQ